MWSNPNHVRFRAALALLVLAAGMMSVTSWGASEKEVAWLITPEEAGMAPAPGIPGGSHLDVGRDDVMSGPIIEVIKPTDGAHDPAPIEVHIKFSAQFAPVDLATLKISVEKFISIDITDRVRDHVTLEGIHVKEAKIPRGAYTVLISLADVEGAWSRKTIWFEVL
jgi:hypothetical protein